MPKVLSACSRIPLVGGVLAALMVAGIVMVNSPGLAGRDGLLIRDSFTSEETGLIQEGDIILRKGVGMPSEVIATVLGEGLSLSHCAIVVIPLEENLRSMSADRISFRNEGGMVSRGKPAVIHTINASLSGVDGVQIQDLGHFNHYSSDQSLVVIRPRMDSATRAAFISRAWAMLQEARPFDNRYDLGESRNLYCSELIFSIFNDIDWFGREYQVKVMGVLGFGSFLEPGLYQVVLSHNPAISRNR